MLEEEGTNPALHLALEVLTIEQIETVPEVRKAFSSILRIGKEEHEARHRICRVFTETLWEGEQMARRGQQPDEDSYLRRTRRLMKESKEVIKEQGEQEVSDMRLPSDEEWKNARLDSEEAFHRALAMPNKTIPEALIQGAELVNAIAARVLLLMAGLTEPKRGVMYEDELEARAAIDTFREACNDVLNRFDEGLEFFAKLREGL